MSDHYIAIWHQQLDREGNLCLSMLIKRYQLNWKKRGKVMCEHAHSQCTGNWKKERVKVMFLSMLLKRHQVLFMSMLRHDFPSLFSSC